MGLLEIGLVIAFMGLFLGFIYGLIWFVGFISCFPGIDGEWIWLLEIGLAVGFVSWIWEELEA